jgi:hypothetical protein
LWTRWIDGFSVFLFVFEEGYKGLKVGFLKLFGEGGFPGGFYGDFGHKAKVWEEGFIGR